MRNFVQIVKLLWENITDMWLVVISDVQEGHEVILLRKTRRQVFEAKLAHNIS